MRIQIFCNGFKLTPSIKKYIDQKIGKIEKLIKRFQDEALIDISISRISHHRLGEVFEIDLNVHLLKKIIRTREKGSDVYALIDIVEEEISRQLNTEKDRFLTKAIKGARILKQLK